MYFVTSVGGDGVRGMCLSLILSVVLCLGRYLLSAYMPVDRSIIYYYSITGNTRIVLLVVTMDIIHQYPPSFPKLHYTQCYIVVLWYVQKSQRKLLD